MREPTLRPCSTAFSERTRRSAGRPCATSRMRRRTSSRRIARVRDGCRWEHAGQPFFEGEVEPCINGRTVALGAYFGQDVDAVVERLLGEQLEDGGWNCEEERGSIRSSFA